MQRNAQWLVQDVGFDGFRLDAVKHVEPWVFNYLDRAVYEANPRLRLDGSRATPFSFGEALDGDQNLLQQYVRKDAASTSPDVVGGNRDVLDFPLHFALKGNLTRNGFQNDWRNVVDASFDRNDDGLANNGSQGVAFDASHDDNGAALGNVANAYLAMRPGNWVVYHNAEEFGDNRDFPKDGRGDALGGTFGDTIPTLVGLRNTHGRGDYRERLLEKETLIYERENSALVVLSNRTDEGLRFSRRVQTALRARHPAGREDRQRRGGWEHPRGRHGQRRRHRRRPRQAGGQRRRLPRLRPADARGHPDARRDRTASCRVPRRPRRTTAPPRLADLDVVTGDDFTVNLNTVAVTLPDGFRDTDADGDAAFLRVNAGIDVNGNGRVDFVDPADGTVYGFEGFGDKSSPLALRGDGQFVQTVDTTALPEGVNHIEARAFRQREDGGPAVYTAWRESIYVDRLPPEVALAGVTEQGPGRPATSRDVFVESTDRTADSVHVFLDLPENLTDAEILARVDGANAAGRRDRDLSRLRLRRRDERQPRRGPSSPSSRPATAASPASPAWRPTPASGSASATSTPTAQFTTGDVFGADAFEQVLYSQGDEFNAAADVDGDGRVTNLDLFALRPAYEDFGAIAAAGEAREAEIRRGNVNLDNATDAADIDHLYANLGSSDWQADLDSDGTVDADDVDLLVELIFDTNYGDADLDGVVDFADLRAAGGQLRARRGWGVGAGRLRRQRPDGPR